LRIVARLFKIGITKASINLNSTIISSKVAQANPGDAGKIVNGKLDLNYDKKVQAQWVGDIPRHIALANKN
jgi:hypothetical protein